MSPDTPPRLHLCICVCTRERPQMLSRFIDSYLQLRLPEGLSISLEVVENETNRRLEAPVTQAGTDSHPIHYHHQPKIGIPCARNTSVRAALEQHASHIAFVDDDERFDPGWLVTIWDYLGEQSVATVVQGAVYSVLPASAPGHFQDYFQRQVEPTDTELNTCRTNNVILPLAVLVQHELWFDESKPLAGGTDSKLFRKVRACGIPLRSCAEAVMYEDIPESRANLQWLSHRNFRIGLTMGKLFTSHDGGNPHLYFLQQTAKSGRYLLKYSARTLLLQPPEKRVKYWLKFCKTLGCGLGALGVKIDSYKQVQGH